MKYLSVSVVGVDGTGKSTIVNSLHDLLGHDKSVIQYMGMKNWETELGCKYLDKEAVSFADKIKRYYAQVVELLHRIKKYEGDSRIVIFDRYIDEQILQFDKNGLNWKNRPIKLLYQILLGRSCYSPTITFYLTCDLETSINRKDDIISDVDRKRLEINKKILDIHYAKKKNTVVINTTNLSVEEVMVTIEKSLKEVLC